MKIIEENYEKKKGWSARRKIGLGLLSLILALAAYELYNNVYIPDQKRQEHLRKLKPYMDAGLTEQQADWFRGNFTETNDNATWVTLSTNWVQLPETIRNVFRSTGSLKETNEFGGYVKGLDDTLKDAFREYSRALAEYPLHPLTTLML